MSAVTQTARHLGKRRIGIGHAVKTAVAETQVGDAILQRQSGHVAFDELRLHRWESCSAPTCPTQHLRLDVHTNPGQTLLGMQAA